MDTEIPILKITAAQARALLPGLEASCFSLAELARQRDVDCNLPSDTLAGRAEALMA